MAASAGPLFNEILPWLLALLAVVVIGGIVLYALRRRLTGHQGGAVEGFTLHELRELHESGELTDEEFERARAAMIEHVRDASKANDESTPDAEAAEE